MNKIILQLKGGREFVFECEEYSLETFKVNGSICDFTYNGCVEECPIWFATDDIEAIAVVRKGED